ncbi:hypothetical protein ZWY2020_037303 [Hordeum vulgare]|nr:hypothetical protein ZWY2020_037303 [Hordeum vulgare]
MEVHLSLRRLNATLRTAMLILKGVINFEYQEPNLDKRINLRTTTPWSCCGLLLPCTRGPSRELPGPAAPRHAAHAVCARKAPAKRLPS